MHVLPLTELDERQFDSALAVQQRDELARDPGVAPITSPELARWARYDRTEGNRHERLAVLDDDRSRAVVHLELDSSEANRHRADLEIFGATHDPEAGVTGLSAALEIAATDNRSVITAWAPNTDDHARFWTGVGAALGLRERISSLDMTAVDTDLMDSWILDGARRAPEVEIVRWVDRCPDEYLAQWVESQLAMNDMPLEGLDINAWTIDAEDVRREEETIHDLGLHSMSILAVDGNGRAGAHTRVIVNPTRPPASFQWDTAVVDRQRGRGTGKWIKAEMWRWLRNTEPGVTRLSTGNAQSNDAMLAINVAMGYVPIMELGAWQAPIDEIRRQVS